jgi:hypothetical protein
MNREDAPRKREPWRWSQFSLRELLVAFSLLAFLYGLVAVRVGRDYVLPTFFGSLALVWAMLSWKTVRLNPSYFSFV